MYINNVRSRLVPWGSIVKNFPKIVKYPEKNWSCSFVKVFLRSFFPKKKTNRKKNLFIYTPVPSNPSSKHTKFFKQKRRFK